MVWTVAIILVCAFALWKGERIERTVAIAFMAAWLLTLIVDDRWRWGDPQWNVIAVDVALLVVLAGLAMTTGLNWLLFAAAFQLLGVATHLAIIVEPRFVAKTYLTGLILWSYLVIASLAVGTWIAWRARDAPRPSR